MRDRTICNKLMALALALGLMVPVTGTQAQSAEELKELIRMRDELMQQMEQFNQRIDALESELADQPAVSEPPAITSEPPAVPVPEPASESPTLVSGINEREPYEPGKGFVIASGDHGEISLGLFAYARYLNQKDLDETYTDSFGRTRPIDTRNDLQFAKVNITFKGWVFDPKFRFLSYVWTSNASQGDSAQVVVAGNLGYRFNDYFNLYAGIGALPSTRSTNDSFPNWVRNDNRTMSDEFFRGSYTSGIWSQGAVTDKVRYKAMLGNNLSQLGVSASELDDELNTFSTALWWMPTTGEYGPGSGFGDFEFHEEVATIFGVNYTRSREDAQGQPEVDDFENAQIRLSDGTLIFSPDPFNTGGRIAKATYEMFALNAGVKYRGWSLDAEYFHRVVDDFDVIRGSIPVTELNDDGYQLQASTMVIPKKLQLYTTYAKINGEYGDPTELGLGLNWFPFNRKEMRINLQGLKLDNSPVGYSSVPYTVGGNGWAFSSDVVINF